MSESELSAQIEEIRNRLLKLEARITRLESPNQRRAPSAKKTSIKEFIIEKGISTDTDKAVVIGFFEEKFVGLNSFNVDDLESGFREAKEPIPKNLNETVNKNVRKGYIMESGEKDGKKAWTLTNSGESYVGELGNQ